MVTARIDFKKIKEERDLSYLEAWYCPLETARESEFDVTPDKKFQVTALSQFAPSLVLNKIPLCVSRKQVMAGY